MAKVEVFPPTTKKVCLDLCKLGNFRVPRMGNGKVGLLRSRELSAIRRKLHEKVLRILISYRRNVDMNPCL